MAKNRALISEEPLEVKHVSWETRAVFRMVATPRKVLARLLSMPQSDSYSSNLISADGSRNPISEAALKSLKFPRGTAGVEFSYSYVSYVLLMFLMCLVVVVQQRFGSSLIFTKRRFLCRETSGVCFR